MDGARRHANTSSACDRVAGEDDGVRLQHVDHVEAVGQDDADLAQVGSRSLDDLVARGQDEEDAAGGLPASEAVDHGPGLDGVQAKPSTTLTAPSAALALRARSAAADLALTTE